MRISWKLTALVAVCLSSSCATPETERSAPDSNSPVSSAPVASESVRQVAGATLAFSDASIEEPVENFLVISAVLLPDGRIAVLYDVSYPQAGGESGLQSPRVAMLTAGSVEVLDLPILDDVQVADTAVPLASSAAGHLLLWDGPAGRLLELSNTNEWSVRAEPPTSSNGGLKAAYGPSGTLYVATGGSVYAFPVGQAGHLVAGTSVENEDPDGEPPTPLGEFPRPAMAEPLPLIRSIVVGDDETVYLGFEHTLLALSGGQLTLFADEHTTSSDGRTVIAAPSFGGDGTITGTFLTALAVDVDGAVLVSDSGGERILRFATGRGEELTTEASGLSNGSRVSDSAQQTLLIFRDGGDSLWTVQR